ncbi:hypothetical protein SKAU_G00147580 [Synaphobranchus kaupii]|uniref:PiggyBac transposable element-derived protein domain-containing protein n=1 Tax=Synaphobranchus kaupii TaxID=118154 RepID=A0A9Q1J2Q3_SYNKA|nr:hypothetical protein SKAU_G00147580 [Synaphobranchus kaupii]
MAKYITMPEVLEIWSSESERESDGCSDSESIDVVLDVDTQDLQGTRTNQGAVPCYGTWPLPESSLGTPIKQQPLSDAEGKGVNIDQKAGEQQEQVTEDIQGLAVEKGSSRQQQGGIGTQHIYGQVVEKCSSRQVQGGTSSQDIQAEVVEKCSSRQAQGGIGTQVIYGQAVEKYSSRQEQVGVGTEDIQGLAVEKGSSRQDQGDVGIQGIRDKVVESCSSRQEQGGTGTQDIYSQVMEKCSSSQEQVSKGTEDIQGLAVEKCSSRQEQGDTGTQDIYSQVMEKCSSRQEQVSKGTEDIQGLAVEKCSSRQEQVCKGTEDIQCLAVEKGSSRQEQVCKGTEDIQCLAVENGSSRQEQVGEGTEDIQGLAVEKGPSRQERGGISTQDIYGQVLEKCSSRVNEQAVSERPRLLLRLKKSHRRWEREDQGDVGIQDIRDQVMESCSSRVEDASGPDRPGASAVPPPSTQSPSAAARPGRTPVKRTVSGDFQSPCTKRRATKEAWRDLSNEDQEPHQFPFCPRRTPGVQLDRQQDYSPMELFQLFFSKEAVKILCQNTNKNKERKRLQGLRTALFLKDVDANDMLKYLSLVIYLGLLKPSTPRDLWRRDRLHTHPFPASVMPGYKFEAIGSLLHMSDPAGDVVNDQLRGQEGYDPLFRLKPLHDQILMSCRAYYHPNQNLAIDERMVAMKGRHVMKQHMKAKPIKWGFKLFVLAESKTGYTCEFSVYQGKSLSPSGKGQSFDSAVNLLRVRFLGTGFRIFVDNFFTSTALFRHLHQIHYGACGTMKEKSTCFPKTEVNALPKRADRGDMRWIRRGPLLYVKWKDSRDVHLCSTIHKAYSGQSAQRRMKNPNGTWRCRSVPVPDPVVEYNKYMGGVDLSDALIKYYNVGQKTMRWYKKLFLHFVDIAVVNSHIIHKELARMKGRVPLTQKQFREALCTQLADVDAKRKEANMIAKAMASEPQPPPPPPPQPRPQPAARGQQSCFPVTVVDVSTSEYREKASKGRRLCGLCLSRKQHNKTMYKCRYCDVPLCIKPDRLCFAEWHKLHMTQAP